LLAPLPPEWVENDGPFLARHLGKLIGRAGRLNELLGEVLYYLQHKPAYCAPPPGAFDGSQMPW